MVRGYGILLTTNNNVGIIGYFSTQFKIHYCIILASDARAKGGSYWVKTLHQMLCVSC